MHILKHILKISNNIVMLVQPVYCYKYFLLAIFEK